jgi:SAM-dependent methyltransferase
MTAVDRFTGRAGVYSKYRPGYPAEYIDYLIAANLLAAGSVIADIGAGTGILSRQLLERGLKVLAVEPNADMRKTSEQQMASYPAFISVNGAAEDTTLESASVDLVTAAQAFHWFDHEKFKIECRRILKEGTKVALAWNSRDYTYELVQENEELCKEYCPDFVAFSHGIESTPEVFAAFFKGGAYEFCSFRNDVQYDIEGFIGRNLSGSYSPAEGDSNYRPFIEGLTTLFNRFSSHGQLIVPSITRSYMGNV